MTEVLINTEYIKLDSLMKYAGWCDTGGEAKYKIQAGKIYVNGSICKQRGKKIYTGDKIEHFGVSGGVITVVSKVQT